MLHCNQIFNNKTLNIFTDASMRTFKNEVIGAPGYVAVIGNEIVYEDIRILRQSTNSESELYAIYMAIQYALVNRHKVQVINIFSDSQFAIYGLREWIFGWMHNIRNDRIYNSSKKEVAHQNIFMSIIYTILQYDLQINLYHNRGHFTETKIKQFIELFKVHNFLCEYIDFDTARMIMKYNNHIDIATRTKLYNCSLPDKLQIPDYLARNDLDMNHYKELLNI